MTSDLLTEGEAIAKLESLKAAGRNFLGLDGIEITNDGKHLGRLDLILDLSDAGTEAYRLGEEFIRTHGGPNIMFELVWH